MPSPYRGLKPNRWLEITKKLLDNHPLAQDEIVDVVLSVWKSIFDSKMGTKGFRIGKDIFPKPQIMGFFLHELIPLELAARYPNKWRGEKIHLTRTLFIYLTIDTPLKSRHLRTQTIFTVIEVTPRQLHRKERKQNLDIIWR